MKRQTKMEFAARLRMKQVRGKTQSVVVTVPRTIVDILSIEAFIKEHGKDAFAWFQMELIRLD